MNTLTSLWLITVTLILIIVIVRRVRGEPLDLKDAAVTPIVLMAIGIAMLTHVTLTAVDLVWLTALSVVSLAFGVARSVTITIERRGGQLVQRYRWKTFALLLASLAVGAALGQLAQNFGMHEAARPLIFTIGVGLAGEGIVSLIRAYRRGLDMPWKTLGDELRNRIVDHR